MERRYKIRPGRDEDFPVLQRIERDAAVVFAPYGLDGVLSRLLTSTEVLKEAADGARLWVAVDSSGAQVGFATVSEIDGLAHLDELDVLPEHSRKGVGTALVETSLRWALRKGYRAMTLSTLRRVPWNAPFYRKLGFRVLAPHQLSRGLRKLLDDERARGLPMEGRVIMRRNLDESAQRNRKRAR